MSLPEHLQYLTKIWDVTPDMTAEKARNMLLEEERKGERPKFPEEEEKAAFAAAAVGGRAGKPPCKTCERLHGPVCWTECPDLAPEWYQQQGGIKRKRIESGEAQAAIAYSF